MKWETTSKAIYRKKGEPWAQPETDLCNEMGDLGWEPWHREGIVRGDELGAEIFFKRQRSE